MSVPVISVKDLGKKYRIGKAEKRADTVLSAILNGIKQPIENLKQIRSLSKLEYDEASIIWALKNISFEVRQGEVLGVIGRNGAGKSTLLKILSRITEPSEGEVVIHGRVASLLEVGTGFHPELTGRENIYMNGTILGMRRREIDQKLDEIIDFSGVEKYMDTPVKFYSSGMRVRLGFSVAAHLEPEILIIDEVLAVGDVEFQKKCIGKMENVAKYQGRTVLFVSHNMHAVNELCSRTILISEGRIAYQGSTEEAVNYYIRGHQEKSNSWLGKDQNVSRPAKDFKSVYCFVEGQQPDLTLKVFFEVSHNASEHDCFVAFDIINSRGEPIMQALPTLNHFVCRENGSLYECSIFLTGLVPGTYYLTCWMGKHNSMTDSFVEQAVSFTINSSPTKGRTYPHTGDHGHIVPPTTIQPIPQDEFDSAKSKAEMFVC